MNSNGNLNGKLNLPINITKKYTRRRSEGYIYCYQYVNTVWYSK